MRGPPSPSSQLVGTKYKSYLLILQYIEKFPFFGGVDSHVVFRVSSLCQSKEFAIRTETHSFIARELGSFDLARLFAAQVVDSHFDLLLLKSIQTISYLEFREDEQLA
jgi:hypothetical protein